MSTPTVVIAGIVAVHLGFGTPAWAQSPNTLSETERGQGWTLLFNGQDFDGWRQCNGTGMPANWVVEDQSMKVFAAQGRAVGQGGGGDIVFGAATFRDFELSIDWKTERGGNSGIFFNVREVPGKPIYYAAPEVQILDNAEAVDNKIPSHLAGSLYDMLGADPKSVKPAGEWNTIVVRVKDGKVTHTQNGMQVVEYELWTTTWDEMVRNSKFKTFPGFTEGIAREGFIGLQDHGHAIWFRNIKIREL